MAEEHKEQLALLRKQLDYYNKRIYELEQSISNNDNCITAEHMRKRVAEFDSDPKWKAFIADTERGWNGVVEDIMGLLDESYSFLLEFIEEEYPGRQGVSIVGKKGSKEWFEFQFLAIAKILKPKEGDYEQYDFADTANGCDETAQEAALKVIEEKIQGTQKMV